MHGEKKGSLVPQIECWYVEGTKGTNQCAHGKMNNFACKGDERYEFKEDLTLQLV